MYLIPLLLLLALVAFFYWKNRSAQRQERWAIPTNLSQLLQSHVGFYQKLSAEEKLQFEQRIAAFLDEVRMEGVGVAVEELDRVLVAASAIIPIFGYQAWKYRNLTNVILYPDTFNGEFQYEGADRNILGMVGSGYMNGQMILSRSSLRRGFSDQADKHNTAIHEFVHLLDKSDGAVDGVPENLLQHQYSLPWLRMMQQEIQRIKAGDSELTRMPPPLKVSSWPWCPSIFLNGLLCWKPNTPNCTGCLPGFFSRIPNTRRKSNRVAIFHLLVSGALMTTKNSSSSL